MPFQIAIDGPAASGKSTVARLVAAKLGAAYVNTGDLYRTVAWAALGRGIDPASDPEGVVRLLPGLDLHFSATPQGMLLLLNGSPVPYDAIRAPEVAAVVSYVARIPAVRQWLIARQQETAAHGNVVMEGRDIGTVIFPRARYKYYITASPEVRARRRLAQSGETVADATVQSVAADIAERDRIDSSRAVAPLRPAADAEIIDTDSLTAEQVAERIVKNVRAGEQQAHA